MLKDFFLKKKKKINKLKKKKLKSINSALFEPASIREGSSLAKVKEWKEFSGLEQRLKTKIKVMN